MYLTFPRYRLRVSVLALPAFFLLLWLEGPIPFGIMLFSAFCHELGHLTALKKCRRRARRIDILPMGALIVCPEGIPDRDECLIALFGPLASLLLFSVFGLLYCVFGSVFFLFGAVINAVLGFFNLIPISKLDGGKALLCFLLWKKGKEKAEQICSAISLAALGLVTMSVIAVICLSSFNLGVIILSLSLLLQLI